MTRHPAQLRRGGLYGWLGPYREKQEDQQLKSLRTRSRRQALPHNDAQGRHVVALRLEFGARKRFPLCYRGGTFVVRHGSGTGASAPGSDVVFELSEDGRPAAPTKPIPSRFIAGEISACGGQLANATAADGSLLVVDGSAGGVWRGAAS